MLLSAVVIQSIVQKKSMQNTRTILTSILPSLHTRDISSTNHEEIVRARHSKSLNDVTTIPRVNGTTTKATDEVVVNDTAVELLLYFSLDKIIISTHHLYKYEHIRQLYQYIKAIQAPNTACYCRKR